MSRRPNFRPNLVRLEERDVPALINISSLSPRYEDEQITINLHRDGSLVNALYVPLTFTGTAKLGVDYSATRVIGFEAGSAGAQIQIDGIHDAAPEADVTVVVNFGAISGYTVPPPQPVDFWDDDRLPTVDVVGPASIAEDGGVAYYGVKRVPNMQGPRVTQKQLATGLNVQLDYSGTATPGLDHGGSMSPYLFIPPYQTYSATSKLTALSDQVIDPDETITVTVLPGSNYAPGTPVTTVIVEPPLIRSVKWESTGTPEGGVLDDKTAGIPGGGQRIFAESKKYQDAVVADKVTVKVQLTQAVAGVTVNGYVYDVDDPSSNQAPVDDETGDSDNRDAKGVVAFSGVSNGDGVVTAVVQVSPRPGDNYRAVATVDAVALPGAVKAKKDDGVLAGVYFTQGGAAVPEANDKTVKSKLLTVWRTLHVEQDRMAAPGANDGPFDGAGVYNTEIGKDDVDPAGPIPDPPLTHIEESLKVGYVEVAADLAALNTVRDWKFVHNIDNADIVIASEPSSNNKGGTRDVASSPDFWTVQLLGAYEYMWPNDGDRPIDPANPDRTRTTGGVSFGVGILGDPSATAIFTESIRDYAASVQGLPNAKDQATILKRIVTHEVGHRFRALHEDGGVMSEGLTPAAFNSDEQARFTPITLVRIRTYNNPN